MRKCKWLIVLLVIIFNYGPLLFSENQKDYMQEDKSERDIRMGWWREARFGMFIHWGIYSIPGGIWKDRETKATGEWIMCNSKIPLAEYKQLVKQFNPVKYNPDEWIRTAKAAGMHYIVITSKHHDGFCLWDSKYTEYDVMSTPYGKDLLKPLSEACKRYGIKLCFYHSIMDWQHSNYEPLPKWDLNRKGHYPDYDLYVNYMKNQLKELIENYGPLGILWFDGEWQDTWTHERGLDLYNYVRSLKPDIIINNRVDKGRKGMEGFNKSSEFAGDYGTPEQRIPVKGIPGVDWESCMTMNRTWGYKKNDNNWKSSRSLIRKLIDIASKGGNFLLNVGPTAEGLIPEESEKRLSDMGEWMEINSESIHGTSANPIGEVPFGRITVKPGKLFLHVFNWPVDGWLVAGNLDMPVKKVYLLADKNQSELKTRYKNNILEISVPKKMPDKNATVIVIEN